MLKSITLALLSVWLFLAARPALAQEPLNPPAGAAPAPAVKTPSADKAPPNELALGNQAIYQKSLGALTMLFVVAVLLESAFSTLFNWRVFLAYFSLRGVKTIIMVVVCLVIVTVFQIDVFADLLAAYKSPVASPPAVPDYNWMSRFITALILAGGSAGVYNLMAALGYRNPRREQEVAPQPAAHEAWVAIWVRRLAAVGPVTISIQSLGLASAYQPPPPPSPIAGIAGGRRPRLLELLLRNQNRFPQNGGYTVTPDVVYAITVQGKDRTGRPLTVLNGEKYVFAKGAIVDFEVTL